MDIEIKEDLAKAIISIIDMCSRRGAFEGVDLEGVGAIRKELIVKLQQNQQAQQAPVEGELLDKIVP